MKLTEWFPGNEKPTIVGVYETSYLDDEGWYQFWNGKFWGFSARSVDDAFEFAKEESDLQDAKWRGLAEDPNGSKP